MGEGVFEQKALVKAVDSAWQEQQQERAAEVLRVATPGGRFHVRWDEGGSATALGQLVFFAEFLDVSGLFARWVDGCPMADTSPNAPAVGNVLGTWLLSILDGQRRYAHVTGLRGDAVAPQILGMDNIVSDESLRRALAHLAPNQRASVANHRPLARPDALHRQPNPCGQTAKSITSPLAYSSVGSRIELTEEFRLNGPRVTALAVLGTAAARRVGIPDGDSH